jgi:hypothetical protein
METAMRLQLTTPILILTAALVAGSCSSPTPTVLQMKFVPTKAYRLSIRTESALTYIGDSGAGEPLKLASTFVYIVRAEQIYENGDTGVSITPEKIERPLAQGVGPAMQGQTFTARISPRGQFVEFGGTDALRAHVARSLSTPKSSETGDLSGPLRSISDAMFAHTFDKVFNVWPAGPVAPRDTWDREPIFNPATNAYEFTQFRLTAVDSTGARIDFESKFRADKEANSPSLGKATGELQLSTTDGILRSLREESDVTVSLTDTSKMNAKTTTYVTFVPL